MPSGRPKNHMGVHRGRSAAVTFEDRGYEFPTWGGYFLPLSIFAKTTPAQQKAVHGEATKSKGSPASPDEFVWSTRRLSYFFVTLAAAGPTAPLVAESQCSTSFPFTTRSMSNHVVVYFLPGADGSSYSFTNDSVT